VINPGIYLSKSWCSICLPRNKGGLGIRTMKSTNLALLTKLGWTFINQGHKVWVQQLTKKYIPYGNFFSAPLPHLLLGCEKVFRNVNICLLLVPVSKSQSLRIFLSGLLHGFLLYHLFSLKQNFQITRSSRWVLSRILSRLAQINGISMPFIQSLMMSRFWRFQKFIFLSILRPVISGIFLPPTNFLRNLPIFSFRNPSLPFLLWMVFPPPFGKISGA
jgi:hypothetical protein